MLEEEFFETRTEQSAVKAAIVHEYFGAWANVMVRQVNRLAYIDLFAGPGKYKDGTPSTPLLVLAEALSHPELRGRLLTVFNDKNAQFAETLKREIEDFPDIHLLKHKPVVTNLEVGSQIASRLQAMRLPPTLLFADPCGYKGLTLPLIASVLKDWGCDCIFFLNYVRVNMHLSNPKQEEALGEMLGESLAGRLRQMIAGLTPADREMAVINALTEEMHALGANHVLPFCFKDSSGTRTSHFLFFVTKHFRGFEIMRRIMAKHSSESRQGVPSFTYIPADSRFQLLFDYVRPLDQLADMLLDTYSGRTLMMREIYEDHSVGRGYLERNYKDVLMRLEQEGRITADPPSRKRRAGTFAGHVRVTFPPKEG